MMAESLGFEHSPFMRFLGLELVRAEEGSVEIRLPFRDEFLRSDGSDWLHGGVVSSLADIVGDYAVITKTGTGVPTIDLRVDYLRPARRGDLVATGRTLRVVKETEMRHPGVIEERHGCPAPLRAWGGVGGHIGAPHVNR